MPRVMAPSNPVADPIPMMCLHRFLSRLLFPHNHQFTRSLIRKWILSRTTLHRCQEAFRRDLRTTCDRLQGRSLNTIRRLATIQGCTRSLPQRAKLLSQQRDRSTMQSSLGEDIVYTPSCRIEANPFSRHHRDASMVRPERMEAEVLPASVAEPVTSLRSNSLPRTTAESTESFHNPLRDH